MTVDLEALVERSTKLRPATKTKYKRAAQQWITYAGADPINWTPLAAQNFYDWLITPKPNGGGLKVNSAAGMFRGLQYIAKRYALLYSAHDFAAGIEMARSAGRNEMAALSLDSTRALLAACAGPDPLAIRDRAMVILGITTGARRASITSVGVTGFGLITPSVGLPYQAVSMGMKGGYTYQVPLSRYATEACYAWRSWLHSHSVREGALFRSVSIPTIKSVRKIGTAALTPDGLYKALQKRAAKAGIGDFHPHILRHTFVTWMRAAKVPTEHVAAVTSHASGDEGRASVMERIYFHKESVAGAAVASVESVFAPLFC